MINRSDPPVNPSRLSACISGLSMPFRALRILFQYKGLKRFALLPLLANAVLYALVIMLGFYLIHAWNPQVGPWAFWGGAWMAGSLNWSFNVLKWVMGIPLIFIACYFSFTSIGMILTSPLNDILSDRVQRSLCKPPLDGKLGLRLTASIFLKSLKESTWLVIKQMVATVLVLPFLLIPLVGFLPLLFVTAYFSGLGFMDASLARNNLCGRHKAVITKKHYWEIFGMGLAMELLFYIPFVGLLIMPLGVTAGTLLYCGSRWSMAFEEAGLTAPEGFDPPRLLNADETKG